MVQRGVRLDGPSDEQPGLRLHPVRPERLERRRVINRQRWALGREPLQSLTSRLFTAVSA